MDLIEFAKFTDDGGVEPFVGIHMHSYISRRLRGCMSLKFLLHSCISVAVIAQELTC